LTNDERVHLEGETPNARNRNHVHFRNMLPGRRYETIVIGLYIQYIVTVVTVSCDRIIGCSLNLWFTFILHV